MNTYSNYVQQMCFNYTIRRGELPCYLIMHAHYIIATYHSTQLYLHNLSPLQRCIHNNVDSQLHNDSPTQRD